MANDIIIRFTSQDSVTPTANKVVGSINKVDKAGSSAGGSFTNLAKSAKSSMATLAGIGAGVGAVVALGVAVGNVANKATGMYDKFENVRKSLGLMTGSVKVGDELYATMEKIAARTPFSFDDVAQATQKLLAMGFTAEQIPDLLTTIGDTSSAVGGGAEGVDRITLALGQMQAKGKITTEEMMQLQEMGIPAFQLLADATGVSQAALMDMVSQGLIPASGNMEILVDAMDGKYGGMMAQQMGTATQAQSNFYDATDKAYAKLGELLAPSMTDMWNNMADAIIWATGKLEEFYNWGKKASHDYNVNMAMSVGLTREQAEASVRATELQKAQDRAVEAGGGTTYAAAYATDIYTQSTNKSTKELVVNTKEKKSGASASNSLANSERQLKSATDSLTMSYLDIADAQRTVKRTREALEDATNPDTLEGYAIAADRAYYNNELLKNEITRMQARQAQVRKELTKGSLTQEERNELLAEDAQITEDLIGKNLDMRESIINLNKAQKDLDRARDPSRIEEYADANTKAQLGLEKLYDAQVDNINAVKELSPALGGTTNVMDILAYSASLTATPLDDVAGAGGDIRTTFGGTGGTNATLATTAIAVDSIARGAPIASSGVQSLADSFGNLNSANVSQSATGFTALGAGLKSVADSIYTLSRSDLSSTLNELWNRTKDFAQPYYYQSIVQLSNGYKAWAQALKDMQNIDYLGIATGLGLINTYYVSDASRLASFVSNPRDVGTTMRLANHPIGSLGHDIFSLVNLTSFGLNDKWSDDVTRGYNATGSSGGQSAPMPVGMSADTALASRGSGQTIVINLNYGNAPTSVNPLQDVENYIQAQGGLLRI